MRGDITNLNAYTISSGAITGLFQNSQFFTELKSQSELKYGDVVFIGTEVRAVFSTLHAAVYIGSNLFFEKTGHDSAYMYRIVTLSDVEKSYSKDSATWTFLRYTGKQLPPVSEFFVARQDKLLAKDLPTDLSGSLSVEPAFSQGLMSYTFFGQKKINLERLNGRWRLVP